MGSRNATLRTDSVLPSFRGVYLERFLRLVESIDDQDAIAQREAICRELGWCRGLPHENLSHLKYEALLMVLSDLMGQGWRTRFRQRSIFLSRPDYTRGKHLHLDPAIVKAQIRNAFQEERLSKISAPSTVRFLNSLEEPSSGKVPIAELITSGPALAADLRKLSMEAVPADFRHIINPYLQLVRGDARTNIQGISCSISGDIFDISGPFPTSPLPVATFSTSCGTLPANIILSSESPRWATASCNYPNGTRQLVGTWKPWRRTFSDDTESLPVTCLRTPLYGVLPKRSIWKPDENTKTESADTQRASRRRCFAHSNTNSL